MKIAVTGGSGRIGSAITSLALEQGHSIVSIDRAAPASPIADERLTYVTAEVTDYDALVAAFAGCDAVIHMAALPAPFRDPDHIVHNNNVVGSYNALRAAVEHGIMRICQASSVNALGLSFSRAGHFDYLPLDEDHPTYNEEPYGLSKWICEAQADSFARRYEGIRIASMRFHYVVPDKALAVAAYDAETTDVAKNLWAYTLVGAAARACLLSLTADFTGHEAFYIVAPESTKDKPSRELAQRFFPDAEIRGPFEGNAAFFSSAKAERMLGWRHHES